jgi:hypothetical protein
MGVLQINIAVPITSPVIELNKQGNLWPSTFCAAQHCV